MTVDCFGVFGLFFAGLPRFFAGFEAFSSVFLPTCSRAGIAVESLRRSALDRTGR
jgi:hypothetical protein